MNAEVTIETITPFQAQEYLANQVSEQRKQRRSYSERLAKEMKDGRWKLSPDCIVLVKGRLANGQHRLSAVVEAETPVQFLVMRTEDDDLYRVIDSGIKRTEADVLVGMPNSNTIVAVSKLVLRYQGRAGEHSMLQAHALPRGAVLDFVYDNHVRLSESVSLCAGLYAKDKILTTSVGAAIHFLLSDAWGGDTATAFISAVYRGMDDLTHDIHRQLVNNTASKAKLPVEHRFALLIKSANSWILGIRKGVLKFAKDEVFPSIRPKPEAPIEQVAA